MSRVAVTRRFGAGQSLAEAIERRLRASSVALSQALRGLAQGRARRTVGLRGRGFHLGELAGEVLLLLRRHLVELVGQVLEVVARLVGVAVLVGVGFAGRGVRQGATQ